jgi:ABC-type bacteriocin/lantibiotic exporter with double-glycine peptidase domain
MNVHVNRFADRLTSARKLGQKAGYFVALANCIAYFIALLVIALVFWVGGIMYLDGIFTEPGALIQVRNVQLYSMVVAIT